MSYSASRILWLISLWGLILYVIRFSGSTEYTTCTDDFYTEWLINWILLYLESSEKCLLSRRLMPHCSSVASLKAFGPSLCRWIHELSPCSGTPWFNIAHSTVNGSHFLPIYPFFEPFPTLLRLLEAISSSSQNIIHNSAKPTSTKDGCFTHPCSSTELWSWLCIVSRDTCKLLEEEISVYFLTKYLKL